MLFQASKGTGEGGSGKIRFQTANAAMVYPTLITSASQTSSYTNSYSFSFTAPSGYSSPCLVVFLAFNYNCSAPSSVSFGGTSMTICITIRIATIYSRVFTTCLIHPPD